jgi:hypothetical protein
MPPNSDLLICRIRVVVAQMAGHEGKLHWGECINTTGNRVCDPQGQFNREGSEFQTTTYPDVVNLEHDRAHAGCFKMTVPLDQIIDLCAFNGDLDRISGYLCQKDIAKEQTEICEDPPELPPRPMRGSCSPVKDGEDAEAKLLAETIKKNNLRLLNIYTQWKLQVKVWIKKAEKDRTGNGGVGPKAGCQRSPWAARDAKIRELEAENKKLKAKVKELKGSGGAVSTSTVGARSEVADSLQLEEEGKKWRGEFERLAKEKSALANERDDLQRRLKDAEDDKARAQRSHDKELTHAAELSAQKVQVADLTGYARAINEANRPRATFNTPSPSNNDDGSLKYLLGSLPPQ